MVQELSAKLADSVAASKQLAAKMSELRKKARAADGPPPATTRMKNIALRALAMSDCDVEVPLAYLRSKARRADGDEIRAWHASLNNEEKSDLLIQPSATSPMFKQWAEAKKFVQGARVVSWIKTQNKKSVAPNPGTVLHRAAALEAGVLPNGKHSRYRWLGRLMARWGGRKGVFASGAQLTTEEFDRKAAFAPMSIAGWAS